MLVAFECLILDARISRQGSKVIGYSRFWDVQLLGTRVLDSANEVA